MGRPQGTKNTMRTPEEKEQLILEYKESGKGYKRFAREKRINEQIFYRWLRKYNEKGKKGLISQTGKKSGESKGRPQKPRSIEEELRQKIMQLEIENARLKKGYQVKGVGPTKEYDTTFEENTK